MKTVTELKEEQEGQLDFKSEEEYINENSSLKITMPEDHNSVLKDYIVNYVGQHSSPEDDVVTLEMIIEIMAEEFPEFVWALAEENWVRGYEQALLDVDSGKELAAAAEQKS